MATDHRTFADTVADRNPQSFEAKWRTQARRIVDLPLWNHPVARLAAVIIGAVMLAVVISVPLSLGGQLVFAAGSFAGGRATPTPTYAFTNAQTIPTDVRIRSSDGEVSSLRVPAAATIEGVATLRSGRIRLQNANGSELLPLPVPLQIQYWSGATQGWQLNAADTCTKIEATNFAFSFGGNLSACETRIQVGGAAPNYTATLSAPGAGNSGWADLTLNLGATGSGTQCAVGGGAATAAAPWLQFNWKGSVDNPTARATFGVVRSGPVIHRREVFR